jgi:site-specific DNA-methyltransferase (adenine-specific)
MHTVDMVVWDKKKMGLGYRTRRQTEYLLVVQKEPIKVKGTWELHDIPDIWVEQAYRNHPHAKPIELQKQLIMATTEEGDFVCDPASGGYSVFNACQETMRNFVGGDIEFGDDYADF